MRIVLRLRSSIFRTLVVVGGSAILGLATACNSAPLPPFLATYGFEDGLDGWEGRASLSPKDLEWNIRQESKSSLSKKGAVVFTVDATQGEGVVWLQKSVPISAENAEKDTEVNVHISFTAWVEETPPPGTQVLFWAKRSAPLDKESFVRQEPLAASDTGREYRFTEEGVSPSGGTVWLAFGVKAVQGAQVTVHFGQVDVRVTS
jgi:hypothetical protein